MHIYIILRIKIYINVTMKVLLIEKATYPTKIIKKEKEK